MVERRDKGGKRKMIQGGRKVERKDGVRKREGKILKEKGFVEKKPITELKDCGVEGKRG